MFEALKKDYELDILWQTLLYNQLSMYDCLEFAYEIQQEWFRLEDWIYNFLKDKIKLRKDDLLKIDLNKFMDVLFDTAFKDFFSKKKSKGETIPYEAYIMFLSDKFNLDPDTLIKKYTPEQINYYTDWVIYNLNEQTKEWQKKNRLRKEMKEYKQTIDEDKEKKQLDELMKRMDLKSKNK